MLAIEAEKKGFFFFKVYKAGQREDKYKFLF